MQMHTKTNISELHIQTVFQWNVELGNVWSKTYTVQLHSYMICTTMKNRIEYFCMKQKAARVHTK